MQSRSGWVARNERVAVDITANMFQADRRATRVTITDMSFEGCQISGRLNVAVGERLWLHIAGQGCIEAEVCWSDDAKAGARFLAECRV